MRTVTLVVLDTIECDAILRVLPIVGIVAADGVEDDDPASYAMIRRRINGLAEKRARDENQERHSEPLSRERLIEASAILERLRARVAEQSVASYWLGIAPASYGEDAPKMARVLAEERARVLPAVEAALGVIGAAIALTSDVETETVGSTYTHH